MSYTIALQFEDGVSRFIQCGPDELVADAAYREKINIPLDCRDGACGTCKCHCESGSYDLGSDYIEDALTDDEAAGGYVLTCQMKPTSDCVVRVPASSAVCKTEAGTYGVRLAAIDRGSLTTVSFELHSDVPVGFLPGQYANVQVPGTKETRAYSFSSLPNGKALSFLVRDVPDGLMSRYLRSAAEAGDFMVLSGPYGSFYLRPPVRPIVMLAGGTGLAPFLSMLDWLALDPPDVPVFLAYGVNTRADLVEVGRLEALKAKLPSFDFMTCIVDAKSGHPKLGFVTDHLRPEDFGGGDADVYVCGPPPMVEGVRRWMDAHGVRPAGFYFEKFSSAGELARS